MIQTVVGRLRITGFLEGLSYLILLGIAMPLKYYFEFPQAVRVVGMLHGILFIAFIAQSIHATIYYRWPLGRLVILWVASVLPFGTFYVDYAYLRRERI